MAKSELKIEAQNLRKKGLSIKKIAQKLNASTSSVSLWVRNIVLTKTQMEVLEKNSRDPFYGNRLKYIKRVKAKTDRKVKRLQKAGVKEIGSLSRRELFLVGATLYWAEGFKKDSQVGFANSDPKMLRLFQRWLYECFGYNAMDLIPRVTVNISHQQRINEIQRYWSEAVNIPIDAFRKPFYQNFKWKKIYENPNEYFGILRLKVRKSKDFLRKIHGFIDGLRLQADSVKI